jgi:phage gpG-like protein
MTLLSVSRPLCSGESRGYNRWMPVFDEKQEELEHYETMMGVPRGRLAVTMDTITDAMALVGQHGVYCQSHRWPGKPVMDIQIIMKNLTDAKELIQSVMEALKKPA